MWIHVFELKKEMNGEQREWTRKKLKHLWYAYDEMCHILSSQRSDGSPPSTFTFDEFCKFVWKWKI